MTSERRTEALLDAWMSDGPLAVPDRVLDTVAERIAAERQRPGWRVDGRYHDVSTPMKLLLTAAAVIVAALAVLTVIQPIPGGVGGPGPTSSASPSTPSSTPAGALGTPPADCAAFGCLGPLRAGGQVTQTFEPAFSYTVPDGWVHVGDTPHVYTLLPEGFGPADQLQAFSDPVIASQDEACSLAEEPGLGSSTADWISFLAEHPGLDASEPEPFAAGNASGQLIDIRLAGDWDRTCPFSEGVPAVMYLVEPGAPEEGRHWGIAGPERQRLILLETPDDQTVLFNVVSGDGRTWNRLTDAAMPVLSSVSFSEG